ncbi:MAG: class D sortase [Anaerolineales bacterium]|nr:class D sortase [Anaerolineales bacterium]
MPKQRKTLDDYSVEELEAVLARKKLAAREERLQRFQRNGRALPGITFPADEEKFEPELENEVHVAEENLPRSKPHFFSRLLWFVEIAAVAGLVYILFSGMGMLQTLNSETAALGGTPTSTPLIDVVVLPSGHIPPSDESGARPNDEEIPLHLRGLVQSQGVVQAATPSPDQAHSIYIPVLWSSAVPIVQGDGWEQLKKGIGQHIGSTDPGQPGNMVLSAHNDIFGEFFRDLDKMKPGDQIYIQTANREYVYRVTGLRIVEPTDVEIMEPTSKASVTLISCYPYMVDTQRIVVFAELEQEG